MPKKRPSREAAEKIFTDAFSEYGDAIFRHCSFKLFDRQLANDITQEAFMKTWVCIERGDEFENIRAFLYRVADNLIIDYIRKKKSVSLDALQEQGFDPGTEDHTAEKSLEMQRAMSALHKLEEPYRTTIAQRYVEGLSVTEIAELTNDPPNTVSVRLHRGLEQLRSHLRHG